MSPPLPAAQVIHAASGRLRLRIVNMRRNTAFFANLARSMEAVESVGNVHANSVTGTVLIEGTTLTIEEFRKLASEHGWLDLMSPVGAGESISERPPSPIGQEVSRAAPLFVLALAAIQGARGHMLPSALSLLLRAIEMGRADSTRI